MSSLRYIVVAGSCWLTTSVGCAGPAAISGNTSTAAAQRAPSARSAPVDTSWMDRAEREYQAGQRDAALQDASRAFELVVEQQGAQHPALVPPLRLAAAIHRDRGNLSRALALLQQADGIERSTHGEASAQRAGLLRAMAELWQQLGDERTSKLTQARALAIESGAAPAPATQGKASGS